MHKPFPGWTLAVGGFLAIASILPILVVFILRITGLSSPHVDYEPGSPMKRVETNASTHPMLDSSMMVRNTVSGSQPELRLRRSLSPNVPDPETQSI